MNQSSSELNDAVFGDVSALDAMFDLFDVEVIPFHYDAHISWGSPAETPEPAIQRAMPTRASLRQRLTWLGR